MMRVYVRLKPLHRPVPVDIDPAAAVSELRQLVGADALFVAPSQSPNRDAADRELRVLEPLSDIAAVGASVLPHGTVTVDSPPIPATGQQSDSLQREAVHVVEQCVLGGQWSLMREPTPVLTAAGAAVTAEEPSSLRVSPEKGPEHAHGSPVHGVSTTQVTSAPTTAAELPPIAPPLVPVLPGSINLAEVVSVSSNASQPIHRHDSGSTSQQSDVIFEPSLLGEDWDELSAIEIEDGQTATEGGEEPTPSEHGAWSLAGAVMQRVLRWQAREACPVDIGPQARSASVTSVRPEEDESNLCGPRELMLSPAEAVVGFGDNDGLCSSSPEGIPFAWGDNSLGQCLMSRSQRLVLSPEQVSMRRSCVSLSCGSKSSMLVCEQGCLWKWDGSPANDGVTPLDLGTLPTQGVLAAAVGQGQVLALAANGTLLAQAIPCMHEKTGTSNGFSACPDSSKNVAAAPPAWPPHALRYGLCVAAVACGEDHWLALTEAGEAYALGSNAAGQLGIGEAIAEASTPAVVRGRARGVPLRAVAAGARHSLALTISGAVLSWGNNADGCLGLGGARATHKSVHLPAAVAGLQGVVRQIAAGSSHSAVVVQKGRLLLAGSNGHGQLGQPRDRVAVSHDFCRLPATSAGLELNVRIMALGSEHSLLLTYDGELHAFGRNSEGQCGLGSNDVAFVDAPVRVALPALRGRDCSPTVWAIAAGGNHNIVLCSASHEANDRLPDSLMESWGRNSAPPVLPVPPSYGKPNPLRRRLVAASPVGSGGRQCLSDCGASRSSPKRLTSKCFSPDLCMPKDAAISAVAVVPTRAKTWKEGSAGLAGATISASVPMRPYVLLRPVVQPGVATCKFSDVSVARLASVLVNAADDGAALEEVLHMLCAVFARPAVLSSCFCYPGLRKARLDAAGLCRVLAAVCSRMEGCIQPMLDAAAEGLSLLADGPMEDLVDRDQLRAIAVYLCLPARRATAAAGARLSRSVLSNLAHLVMRLPAAGRTALRDLIADECGDVRVLRDFLVPHVRSLADEAIQTTGQQQWLTGPLWEVVAQLQLQRPLWEAVLLLQILASAAEQASCLVQPGRGSGPGTTAAAVLDASNGTTNGADAVPSGPLAEALNFQLTSLAEGFIPPEVEFWLFQEHAQFRQITPAEVVSEPWWSDAASMLPRRFCSFMAHANLVPVAFKQRVLQVENVLRQRLSQEQVLWPAQAEVLLANGRRNPSSLYFMLTVNRQDLLRDAFRQMYSASPIDLRRPLRVEFVGEEAVDEGGVMREFFRLLSQQLFAPDAGLFFQTEESRRRWFRPVLGEGRQLEDYWMVGVILALAVYNNHPGLDVPLPSALFKMLKDEPTTYQDLAQLFPTQANSLDAILSWTPSTSPEESEMAADLADKEFVDIFSLYWCISSPSAPGVDATPSEVPLCEGGADRPVLFRDREAFAVRVHDYLLSMSVQPQFESFARGFRRVCNSPLFKVLSSAELEAIVAGERDLNFERLQQGALYEGFCSTEPYIQNLWDVLQGFSMPRRRRFLAFCTGSDVAPAGGLQDLRLLVQRHGEEPTQRLPVAHTCFNLLLLPRYASIEKLRSMLTTAIECTEGFGLQ